MKKIILLIGIIFSAFFIEAQTKNIQGIINQIHQDEFIHVELFNKKSGTSENYNFSRDLNEYNLSDVSNTNLSQLVRQNHYAIRLEIPYKNSSISLLLVKNQIIDHPTYNTENNVSKSKVSDYQEGVYYYGVVENSNNSVAAISFFNNNIIGVISTSEEGNIVIGKSIETNFESEEYIIYNDKDLKHANPFTCGVEQLKQDVNLKQDEIKKSRTYTTNCVKIYTEFDYQFYQDFSNNVNNVINYANGLFNIVGTLYYNDSIKIALNEVNVWTVSDPYVSAANTNDALDLFRAQMVGGFNGDLAHLLSRRSLGGGIAYVDVLCIAPYYQYQTGVSASLGTGLTPLPTYSWNSEVVTHECGHNIASPHTHSCSWNGNNTRIDNCAGHYNVAYQEGNCVSDPVDPPSGGTIMSYCHLRPVGINFVNGFGPQPGALLRNKVNNAACLTTCVNCPSDITINGVLTDTLIESDTWVVANGVTSMNSTSIVKIDPNPNGGYFQYIPANGSQSFTITPSTSSSYFIAKAEDGCSGLVPSKPQANNDNLSFEDENQHILQMSDFILYPNPASDFITIRNSNLMNESINYDIISIDGKLLSKGRNIQFNESTTIHLGDLSKGLYFIKIFYKSESNTIKFQKK
ncbi:MAG TPA: zinc-dependent metalloprotease [Chitinophagaceae bacterium]|nr:MAG: peptidase M12B ADAM/reprolysin [Bacteroidetes bacterium OLB11]HMN33153.1 zinc-dependent metalloprotease [Chitinophagaceae bacterium]